MTPEELFDNLVSSKSENVPASTDELICAYCIYLLDTLDDATHALLSFHDGKKNFLLWDTTRINIPFKKGERIFWNEFLKKTSGPCNYCKMLHQLRIGAFKSNNPQKYIAQINKIAEKHSDNCSACKPSSLSDYVKENPLLLGYTGALIFNSPINLTPENSETQFNRILAAHLSKEIQQKDKTILCKSEISADKLYTNGDKNSAGAFDILLLIKTKKTKYFLIQIENKFGQDFKGKHILRHILLKQQLPKMDAEISCEVKTIYFSPYNFELDKKLRESVGHLSEEQQTIIHDDLKASNILLFPGEWNKSLNDVDRVLDHGTIKKHVEKLKNFLKKID
ncbi:MAG: hypothetical protein PHD95_03160 [Candidatus ainarchaeum sp.]|nr:hypothetical protein [Candidatus ainarchaeum sp.]